MSEYRLFFLDEKGAIRAREEFIAENNAEATALVALLWDACSETYFGYELWSFGRCLLRSPNGRMSSATMIDELSRHQQEEVLKLEEQLQRSHWTVAKSKRLLEKIEALRDHLNGTRG